MENYEGVINRLKKMECPTGRVEKEVLDILVEYELGNDKNIDIKRYTNIDNNGLEGYWVEVTGENSVKFALLCKSAYDDYVSKVVDVARI